MTKPNIFDIPYPLTSDLIAEQLQAAGLGAGMNIIVHSSLSQLGWVIGGAQAVVDALLSVVTPEGTVMVPAHSTNNTEPAYWENPPIPEDWWQIVRDNTPAFDPHLTETRHMGQIADTLRAHPDAKRSYHPALSFAAVGKHRDFLLDNHALDYPLGEASPLARLYDLDGHVLLLGVNHANNTSLHLGEYRSPWARQHTIIQGGAVRVDGVRQWVNYQDIDFDSSDFAALGESYQSAFNSPVYRIGNAQTCLISQRSLVDYAVSWVKNNRT